MTTNDASDSADLVTNVIQAFDAMPVPAAPAMQETLDALDRATNAVAPNCASPGGSVSTLWWRRLANLTVRQRLAVGGVGLSVAAALVVLAIALSGNRTVAAMERMARQLSEVRSYRYTVRSETTTTDSDTNHRTSWIENGAAYWSAPDAFRGDVKIVKVESPDPAEQREEEVLEDFVEIFPPGGEGIFVNHKLRTYFRSQFEPTGSTAYPLEPLKQIREDAPQRLRELGTKQIDGKTAHGYQVHLVNGFPPRGHDWEVWIDPQTDLPLEIGYQVDDGQQPRTTTVLRISNFRWNEELADELFDPVVPKGYREVFPEKQRE